jgi:hypothetical protein
VKVRGVCITIAMPFRRTLWAGRAPMDSPASRTLPEVGRCRPAIVLSSVLFPAPLGPTTATIAPSSIPNVTPSTAGTPPKCFASSSTSSSGAFSGYGRYAASGFEIVSCFGYHVPPVFVPFGAGPVPNRSSAILGPLSSPHAVQRSLNM